MLKNVVPKDCKAMEPNKKQRCRWRHGVAMVGARLFTFYRDVFPLLSYTARRPSSSSSTCFTAP